MRRQTISSIVALGLLCPVAAYAADARSTADRAATGTSATKVTTAKKAPAKKKKKVVPRFTFRFPGRGFGHGVGMSQYGAYGMALAGKTADEIITTYFTGTTISQLPTTIVRVLLADRTSRVTVSSPGQWVASADGGAQAQALTPGATFTVRNGGSGRILLVQADGATLLQRSGALVLSPMAGGTVSFNGIRYRGSLRITASGSALRVINTVDLEEYLYGVVPREVPASWGNRAPAVLEAQAIAARSYAMATKKTGDFDMYADERSQVYGGASGEDSRTTAAVKATAGKVATYQGRIATTFFFSTSGGRTENSENVFSNPLPYLRGINDAQYDKLSPKNLWRGKDIQTFSDARLGKLLGTKTVLSMKIVKRGVSPRAVRVRITTRTGGVKVMTGADVRRALGLPSSWFEVKRAVK